MRADRRIWVLSWGTAPDLVRLEFDTYEAGVRQLVDELWWGWEDTGDEELMKGWEDARQWFGTAQYNRYTCGYRLEIEEPVGSVDPWMMGMI